MKKITNGETWNYGVMYTAFYSIPKNNVPSIHVYYPTDFLEAFFTNLDTEEVRNFLCDVLTGSDCVNVRWFFLSRQRWAHC